MNIEGQYVNDDDPHISIRSFEQDCVEAAERVAVQEVRRFAVPLLDAINGFLNERGTADE